MNWGRGRNVIPESPRERRVLEDALMWDEYGMPFDARTELSRWEFEAHLAIIEGRNRERSKQNKKMKRNK